MILIALILNTIMNDPFIAAIKHYEGFYSEPYLCPAGKWTIGYGHLCERGHPPISEEKALMYLFTDLAHAYRAVQRAVPELIDDPDIPSHRAMAIVSWTFNLGEGNLRSSTMLKRLKERDWDRALVELKRWDKATDPKTGKKIALKGLTKRRNCEAVYFDTGKVEIF